MRKAIRVMILTMLLVSTLIIPACVLATDDDTLIDHETATIIAADVDTVTSDEEYNDISIEAYIDTSYDTGIIESECGNNFISAMAIADFDEFLAIGADAEDGGQDLSYTD